MGLPLLLTAAPICAAFCSNAVADMRAEGEGNWWSFRSELDDENMAPADTLRGFGGMGMRSCGSVNGGEGRRGTCCWKGEAMVEAMAPRRANLLFSSVKASQKAL